MFIEQKPTHCSKCDSTKSETFFRQMGNGGLSGIRCMDCGHEKFEPILPRTTHEAWTMQASDKQIF